MSKTDLSTMDKAKLTDFVTTARTELATLKRSLSMGQETKTAQVRQKRRDIARGLTLINALNQKEDK